MADMMEMDANLMGAAAVQLAFDQGHILARTNHAIFGFGCTSPRRGDRHSLSMHPMAADLFFNDAGTFSHFPSDEGEIDFFDGARGELLRQHVMGFVVLRDDDAATRIFVEAMDDAGTLFAANSGKI